VQFGFSLPLCGWFGIVGWFAINKYGELRVREISKEEDNLRLAPSSAIVGGLRVGLFQVLLISA